jgi:hypothetical protein
MTVPKPSVFLKLKVRFRLLTTEEGGRKTGVANHVYRPDWVGPKKPEYNGAQIEGLPELPDLLMPGQEATVDLLPLRSEYWGDPEPGDLLYAMEGARKVGEATILEVERLEQHPVV